jgi:thioester reductase-like protein
MKVFLTGATGFLGGELAVLLSQKPEVERLYCLVRGSDPEQAAERLEAVFRLHNDAYDPAKVVPVLGDLTDAALAESLARQREIETCDWVLHSAADTSFNPASEEQVKKVNIGGTRRLLEWARALPQLDTFVYVGTASICGTQLSDRNVLEGQSPDPSATHLVRYCYTKMVGEMDVRRALPEDKLLVVRPSIIMGDSREWEPRSNVILWALAALNLLRLIPANPRANLDVIPVDYAARAIAELMFARRQWNTYHISAGQDSSTNLEKVIAVIRKPSELRPDFKFVSSALLKQMRLWPKKLAPGSDLFDYSEHLDYWRSQFNGKLRLLLAALKPYFRFMELNQTFDNTRLLADTPVGSPAPPHEYLHRTRRFLDDIDVIEGALDP